MVSIVWSCGARVVELHDLNVGHNVNLLISHCLSDLIL